MRATETKLQTKCDASQREIKLLHDQISEMVESAKTNRTQIDDLKARLATAEAENQRMRGYIQRVQEDDVVREDLVPVGDPDGETHLVPKRKPTSFHAPVPMSAAGEIDAGTRSFMYSDREREPPRKAKHWVTY